MVGVALAQPDQEVRHRLLGDPVQVVDARARQVLEVAPQVAAVRRERVRRQPALDRQVVEVGADRPPAVGSDAGRQRKHRLQRDGLDADRLADRAVGELAGVGVEAEREAVVVAAGLLPALVGQRDGVRHGRVGQGVGRGVGHRARHVRHAVEDRVVHLVGRVRVRGGVGVLEAAALVDGDVDQHRARLHPRDQLVADQLGRRGAGDQHRADDHVGLHHLLLDRQLGRRQAVHPVVVAPERHPQLVQVGVEQGHVGAHARARCWRRSGRETPGTDDDDLGVGDPADAAHQHPAAALGLEQRVRADLRRQAAGDLRHRVEQRQPARGQLHGLVGDRGDLAVDQLLGQRLVRGQVEVGEERQPLAHPVVLLGDRLLDLEHHVDAASVPHASSAWPTIVAPAATYSSSGIRDPTPARSGSTTS